jgi:hypothetical protein
MRQVTWPSAGRAYELLNESKMNIQEHYLESLRRSPWRNKRKTPEELEDGEQHERDRPASRGTVHVRDGEDTHMARDGTMMRDGGVQLAPMRPMVGLRNDGMQVTRLRNGMISHPSGSPHPEPQQQQQHRSAPPIVRTMRHASQAQNYPPVPPSAYTPEPMFADTGYPRWGGDLPSFNQADGAGAQGYFGTPNNWDGQMQQPQQPQQQQQQQEQGGQGWTTSAARFSSDNGAGRNPSSTASNAGGYWQDYPPPPFGNDMSSSLYGMMPPVGHTHPHAVGMQSIFHPDAGSYPPNPDGPGGISPSYPVYSRMS